MDFKDQAIIRKEACWGLNNISGGEIS